MKNFHRSLLIVLALSLCGLCAYQWYGQTLQRNQIQQLSQSLYDKSVTIRDNTNSIAVLNQQVAQMDARITELKAEAKTNADLVITQKRESNRMEAIAGGLTNQIAEYKTAVAGLQGKLKEAYDGVQKQNEALKALVAERDEFVEKLNESVKERNVVVNKYNDLVKQVERIQGTNGR